MSDYKVATINYAKNIGGSTVSTVEGDRLIKKSELNTYNCKLKNVLAVYNSYTNEQCVLETDITKKSTDIVPKDIVLTHKTIFDNDRNEGEIPIFYIGDIDFGKYISSPDATTPYQFGFGTTSTDGTNTLYSWYVCEGNTNVDNPKIENTSPSTITDNGSDYLFCCGWTNMTNNLVLQPNSYNIVGSSNLPIANFRPYGALFESGAESNFLFLNYDFVYIDAPDVNVYGLECCTMNYNMSDLNDDLNICPVAFQKDNVFVFETLQEGYNFSVTDFTYIERGAIDIILSNAGFNSTELKSIQLPNSVTTIGEEAFKDIATLETIGIGSHISMVYADAFNNCPLLEKIVITTEQPPLINTDTGELTTSGINLYVPRDSVTLYESDAFWSQFTVLPIEYNIINRE